MKIHAFIFVLLFVGFTSSNCKKVSKYPIDLSGYWITNEGYCSHYYFEIKTDNKGTYGPYAYEHGCDWKKFSGKVRYNKNHLYLGTIKMEFLEKPSLSTGNDSIAWDFGLPNGSMSASGYYRILATMKIQLPATHKRDIYTFKKVLDY